MKAATLNKYRRLALLAAISALPVAAPNQANAFAFVFAGEGSRADIVTHPMGYTGVGGVINLTVGIDPTSAHAAEMGLGIQNALNQLNALSPSNGNVQFGGTPSGQYDFESAALHELTHALGLDHPNLGAASGVPGSGSNYTQSGNGSNNVYDLNPGPDGIPGSADDIRGDDQNLNYFRKSNNDPFTIAPVVDSTTYSRDLADLPAGSTSSANADRYVGAASGYAGSEAVMQQGQYAGEIQRQLGFDDVAGLLYAMSGVDELAGTADDYIFNLVFLGIDATAQILLDFDSTKTDFAVTMLGGSYIGDPADKHVRITHASIYFSDAIDWFFNDTLSPVPSEGDLEGLVTNAQEVPQAPAPAALPLFGLGLLGLGLLRRRKPA